MERAVELGARQAGSGGRILILLDAEDACPSELGPELLAPATAARPDRDIRVVLARFENEAWFLAAADSIVGHHGMGPLAARPSGPESVRNAKGRLTAGLPSGRSYRETLD